MLPAVFFIFSKNKIMEIAKGLMSRELCTKSEQGEIIRYFNRAIKTLKFADQNLN